MVKKAAGKAKKAATKKPSPAAKKTSAAKATAPRKPAPRVSGAARRPVPSSVRPAPKAPAKPPAPTQPAKAAATSYKPARTPFSRKDLDVFRRLLLNIRDQIVDGISFLAGDNLNHSQREVSGDLSNYGIHMADQGTDNFDREFALSLVSNEQDVLYEIDEALHRIDSGTYGICEVTGKAIEIARLKALPYARCCLEAQTMMERNRKRFRPFQQSAVQPQEV